MDWTRKRGRRQDAIDAVMLGWLFTQDPLTKLTRPEEVTMTEDRYVELAGELEALRRIKRQLEEVTWPTRAESIISEKTPPTIHLPSQKLMEAVNNVAQRIKQIENDLSYIRRKRAEDSKLVSAFFGSKISNVAVVTTEPMTDTQVADILRGLYRANRSAFERGGKLDG